VRVTGVGQVRAGDYGPSGVEALELVAVRGPAPVGSVCRLTSPDPAHGSGAAAFVVHDPRYERESELPSIDQGGRHMAESVYRVTEVIGVSTESWEAAARNAVETAAKTVRELRVAEVVRQDLTIDDGGVLNFRVRLGISFKYDSGD
jgi:dodecin